MYTRIHFPLFYYDYLTERLHIACPHACRNIYASQVFLSHIGNFSAIHWWNAFSPERFFFKAQNLSISLIESEIDDMINRIDYHTWSNLTLYTKRKFYLWVKHEVQCIVEKIIDEITRSPEKYIQLHPISQRISQEKAQQIFLSLQKNLLTTQHSPMMIALFALTPLIACLTNNYFLNFFSTTSLNALPIASWVIMSYILPMGYLTLKINRDRKNIQKEHILMLIRPYQPSLSDVFSELLQHPPLKIDHMVQGSSRKIFHHFQHQALTLPESFIHAPGGIQENLYRFLRLIFQDQEFNEECLTLLTTQTPPKEMKAERKFVDYLVMNLYLNEWVKVFIAIVIYTLAVLFAYFLVIG